MQLRIHQTSSKSATFVYLLAILIQGEKHLLFLQVLDWCTTNLFAALTFDDVDTFFKEPIELCQQFLDLSKEFTSCKSPSVIVSIVNVA